jgi:hypothetical protein
VKTFNIFIIFDKLFRDKRKFFSPKNTETKTFVSTLGGADTGKEFCGMRTAGLEIALKNNHWSPAVL